MIYAPATKPYVIGLFGLMLLLSGCADNPLGDLSDSLNPLLRLPGPEETEYGPTPAQQLASLKQLRSAAKSLSAEKQERASADLFRDLQNEKDPLIRREIVLTLGELPTATAMQGLRLAAADGDANVRIAACEAWRDRGGRDAIGALSEILGSDTDVDVRLAAARALGRFRTRAAVGPLVVALDDPDPALQYRALEALRAVTGRDYGRNADAWRSFAAGENPPLPKQPSLAERVRRLF